MARIISNNSSKIRQFELHPAAKSAIDFFHSIPPQFHFLPSPIRHFVSDHSMIRGVVFDHQLLMPGWDMNRLVPKVLAASLHFQLATLKMWPKPSREYLKHYQ